MNKLNLFPDLKNPIILALDVDDVHQAKLKLSQVGHLVGAIKIGPRLVYKYGFSIVEECRQYAPVFIDNKIFDITSTMLSAVQTCFDAGATFATVHALAGKESLEQISKLEKQLNTVRPFKILAVTILTSWSENSLSKNLSALTLSEHVQCLAQTVVQSGLSGLVCSGHELNLLNDNGDKLYKVVPGIRLGDDMAHEHKMMDDQQRVMTPFVAKKAGAQALVIGRPILNAEYPEQKINSILEMLN